MALSDISVLFVEDDPVFRSLVSAYLVKHGAKVTEAEDGEVGLQYFLTQTFDVVLADLSMPNMGGLEMLRELQKANSQVPAIVISGNNVMADVVEALRVGASDYIVKPVSDLETIETAILQAIKVPPQSEEELQQHQEEQSYKELQENLQLLERDTSAASSIQQQLFPSHCIDYPQANLKYSLFNSDEVSDYFIDSRLVDSQHIVFYMVDMSSNSSQSTFASVLLHSLVTEKLTSFQAGESATVLQPFGMLSYLNEKLLVSGLELDMDIIYVSIDLENLRVAIAKSGNTLRCYIRTEQQLTPLILADTPELGTLDWGEPSSQFRTLSKSEALCISTTHPIHKQSLLHNEFCGHCVSPNLPEGGFIQLSFGESLAS
ncbi:response regulator [Shewanella gelidii]|uniref:Response regulator n=1 Tax=Shewanella gelidii TaxID=1642821 RepID=A0A917JKE6_9GAMM|nr:response regulator [Shewanella gelidii]MCL1096435.1 response regulator [Shewanella gelidii]GGI67392.1 response regulator [Shewanella gelidii]